MKGTRKFPLSIFYKRHIPQSLLCVLQIVFLKEKQKINSKSNSIKKCMWNNERNQNALEEWDGPGHIHFFAEIPNKHWVRGKGCLLLIQWVHLQTNLESGKDGPEKWNKQERINTESITITKWFIQKETKKQTFNYVLYQNEADFQQESTPQVPQ